MKKIIKMVYETPFVEIVPMFSQSLMSAVSTVNHGQGDGDETIIVIGEQDPDLSKEFGFDYDEQFNFGWVND